MEGTQKSVYTLLIELAEKIKDSWYGEDNDFDTDAFEEDLKSGLFEIE